MDSEAEITTPNGGNIEDLGSLNEKVAHLVAEITKHPDMDIAEKKKKVLAAFNLLDETAAPAPEPEPEPAPEEEPEMTPAAEAEDALGQKGEANDLKKEKEEEKDEEKMEESIRALKTSSDPKHKELAEALDARLKSLREKRREIRLFKEAQRYQKRMAYAKKLCSESALPKDQVTGLLLESMAAKKDVKTMKAVLEDRLAIVNVKRPTSGPNFVNRNDPKSASGRKEASDMKSFMESLNRK